MWNTITRGETWRGSFQNRRKDGSVYDVDQTIAPVSDAEGNIMNYVSVARDVTEKRHLTFDDRGLTLAKTAHNNCLAVFDAKCCIGSTRFDDRSFTVLYHEGADLCALFGYNVHYNMAVIGDLWSNLQFDTGLFECHRTDGTAFGSFT